ncbi:MAG: type II toxin-antitoxin system HicB family antitoxin [Campylobacterales bacterium]|nr:type II toxin-antitoxin system HicB family antitoxin [Campylobacterales bacterium]
MVFNAIIEKDENGYFAYVPELKGCVSCGDSYEEAVFNIKEATALYIESLDKKELDLLKSKTVIISPIEVALSA